jgi:hypothetical protein
MSFFPSRHLSSALLWAIVPLATCCLYSTLLWAVVPLVFSFFFIHHCSLFCFLPHDSPPHLTRRIQAIAGSPAPHSHHCMDAPLLQHETVVPAVHAEGECLSIFPNSRFTMRQFLVTFASPQSSPFHCQLLTIAAVPRIVAARVQATFPHSCCVVLWCFGSLFPLSSLRHWSAHSFLSPTLHYHDWQRGDHHDCIILPTCQLINLHQRFLSFRSVPFCSVLFRSVLFCSVLFCSVLFCSVLFCSVLFCSVPFCSVLFCSVLFCSVLFRSVLFRSDPTQPDFPLCVFACAALALQRHSTPFLHPSALYSPLPFFCFVAKLHAQTGTLTGTPADSITQMAT